MTDRQSWITLVWDEDGWWTAREEMIGATARGEARFDALENLDEAVENACAAPDADGSLGDPLPHPDPPDELVGTIEKGFPFVRRIGDRIQRRFY